MGSTCSPSSVGNHSLTWSAKLSLRSPSKSGPSRWTRTMRGVMCSTSATSRTRRLSGYLSMRRSCVTVPVSVMVSPLSSLLVAWFWVRFLEYSGGAQAREGKGEGSDADDGECSAGHQCPGGADEGWEGSEGEGPRRVSDGGLGGPYGVDASAQVVRGVGLQQGVAQDLFHHLAEAEKGQEHEGQGCPGAGAEAEDGGTAEGDGGEEQSAGVLGASCPAAGECCDECPGWGCGVQQSDQGGAGAQDLVGELVDEYLGCGEQHLGQAEEEQGSDDAVSQGE